MRRLTDAVRTDIHNLRLGWFLAFNAGALNAGGFLIVHRYTSHMTGFVSTLADNVLLGQSAIALGALGTLLAFLSGSACTAVMVCWARKRQLHSSYALPLLLIAVLMLMLGLLGAVASHWATPFAVPVAVLLLAFIMGLQNAVMTKMSASKIRTTHMTGVITDIGIELGKWLYWRKSDSTGGSFLQPSKARLVLFSGLLLMFFVGGVVGAAGFKYIGFGCVLPLALVLMMLALPPLWADRARLSRAAATS
jgi:uncharacterized membrane protein YoaK (UPF0700 family)